MQRVLLTGMSGVGRSTVAERLSELGFKVAETDYGGFSAVDDHGNQHWDVDRVRDLLATEDADVLFVVGSDDAQVLFYPDFDHIVLLSAPREVMVERLASRTSNPFGKSSEELAKILADLETFEPFMRRAATHEIDTSKPLDPVIDENPEPGSADAVTMKGRRLVGGPAHERVNAGWPSGRDPSVQAAVRRLDQLRRSLPHLAHPDPGRGQPRAPRVPGRGRRRGRTRRVARRHHEELSKRS